MPSHPSRGRRAHARRATSNKLGFCHCAYSRTACNSMAFPCSLTSFTTFGNVRDSSTSSQRLQIYMRVCINSCASRQSHCCAEGCEFSQVRSDPDTHCAGVGCYVRMSGLKEYAFSVIFVVVLLTAMALIHVVYRSATCLRRSCNLRQTWRSLGVRHEQEGVWASQWVSVADV
eukprot:655244-Amphidinium_carterae.1